MLTCPGRRHQQEDAGQIEKIAGEAREQDEAQQQRGKPRGAEWEREPAVHAAATIRNVASPLAGTSWEYS
jgi:hypothetical protein